MPERNQAEADERVEDEDVALPEVEVHSPDQEQHEQPALEQDEAAIAAPLCSGKLQRKPEAEEQRKERIELAVAEPDRQPRDRKIESGRARGRHHLRSHEHETCERREVEEEYAAERESTQGIEDVEPLGFSSRTRRGGLRAHLHGGIIGRAGCVG